MAEHQMSAAILANTAQSKSPHAFDRVHCFGYDVLRPLFAELMLISSNPTADLVWPELIIHAESFTHTSLAAVQSALLVARHEQLIVIDAAFPVGPVALLDRAAAMAEQRWDVMSLRPAPEIKPVPLVFHRRCEKLIKQHLEKSTGDMDAFLHQVRSHIIDLNPDI